MPLTGNNNSQRRRTASISTPTTPLPPTTSNTTQIQQHNKNSSRSRHQYSRSQQLPSTSLPFGNLFSSSTSSSSSSSGHHYSLSLGSNSSHGTNNSSNNSTIGSSEPSTPSNVLSPSLPQQRTALYPTSNTLSIEFDGDTQMVILRPNRIIRGRVILHAVERTYVTHIQIKFHAEEVAMVKLDNKVHQCITTLFDTQYTVWGDNNATAYAHSGWEEFDVGRYEFPFVLKFPNVNYPPSIEDPPGFNVRYMWTAYMEGPGGQSGISSKCINTPYRPIIAAPADKEWTYRTTLVRDPGIHMGNSKKQHAIAQVLAKLNKQCYCPDEPFSMELTLTTLQSDLKIIQGSFKFRKHHQGKLIVSGGTAQRYVIRDLSHGNIPPPSLASSSSPDTGGFMKKQIISFAIPTRNVSPTFTSRHIRIYYDLHFTITLEESHFLKRHTIQCEFSIPLNIANLPNNELIRVPDLMTIQSYQHQSNNIKYPEFFDPGQTNDTTMTDPPSYYTSSFQRQQQQQRTIYLTCPSSPSYITIPGKSNGNKTPPTTTTLTNSSSHHGSSVTVGCSSTTTTTPNHSHHQRHHSFPDVGEATLIYGIYNEN